MNPNLAVNWAKTCQCIVRFGMQSSPAEFQRLLENLLKDHKQYGIIEFLQEIGCEEQTWKLYVFPFPMESFPFLGSSSPTVSLESPRGAEDDHVSDARHHSAAWRAR